jgi:anti-anti-sigma factor
MPIQQWSDDILVMDLADGPEFNDDVQSLIDRLEKGPANHVALNLSGVESLNSSNLAAMLRLRQKCIGVNRRLRLASAPDALWGILLTTGLDKVFQFSPDVPSALAALQLEG